MKRMPAPAFAIFSLCMFVAGSQLTFSQWIQQRSGVRSKLNDVTMLDSLTAIAVGDRGIILKTTNAGLTWVRKSDSITTVQQSRWNALAFGSLTFGVVVGDEERGALTTNAGETWTVFASGGSVARRNWLSVAIVAQTRLLIGDDSGGVRITNDGGITWQTTRLGAEPISDLFFSSNPIIGYAIAPHVTYKTPNLGATWRTEQLPIPPLSGIRRGDCSPNANAYAVGFMGDFTTTPVILERSAADTAWRVWMFMPPLPVGVLNDVSAPTSETAFACGSTSLIFRTTNAGQFWGLGGMGFRRSLNAIDFLNERRGFVVGDSGAIFFTSTGGGRAVHFFNLVSPRDGDTLRSGEPFRYVWQRAIDLDPDTTWYQVMLSTNGGVIWNYVGGTVDTISPQFTVPPPGRYLWRVIASDGANGTSSEPFSYVTKPPTDVIEDKRSDPDQFALGQNIPNPFNPSTTIFYQLSGTSHVTLKVFDLLGKEVALLVDEEQKVGFRSIVFNAGNLASGIYFYRMEAGGFVATRKLLLLR